MKTAMQELRDSINMSYVHMTMAPETKDIYIYKIALKETLDKIDALLEKEREQIIDFHVMLMKNGLEQEGNVIEWDYNELKEEALNYYNQTYNQNK